MPPSNIPPATLITTDDALRQHLAGWAQASLLALDTESNSLYAYAGRVCLIQLSTRDHDYIIDPFSLSDLSGLGALMADSRIEKVFHAADQDIAILKRDFGWQFVHLFDTLHAARVLGENSVGLSSVLYDHFGVKVDKSHQRDDWGQRPLARDSLLYAQMDTHYLPRLRDIYLQRLQDAGRLEEAREGFAELCLVPAMNAVDFDPEGYWAIGRPARLKRREMRVLRELYLMRDAEARARDVPPFKVLGNKVLVEIAREQPRNFRDLNAVNGLAGSLIRRYGDPILAAVEHAADAPALPRPPRQPAVDPVIAERYAALHTWRKNRAIERGVASDVIISKQILWHIAEHKPVNVDALRDIPGIGPWRLRTYGSEMLAVLDDLP